MNIKYLYYSNQLLFVREIISLCKRGGYIRCQLIVSDIEYSEL